MEQSIRECFSFDELEGQKTKVAELAKVVDAGDVWMVQRRECFGLAPKS